MAECAPLISIIVPVYNVERYLASCVNSVRSQIHRSWELILVDDGSSDASGIIADDLAATDPQIRVFHTVNGGASRARNLGIAASKGEFVFFLDADDRLEPFTLSVLTEMQARTGADMVIGSYNKIFDDQVVVPDDGGLFENVVFDTASLDRHVEGFLRQPHIYTLLAHCWGRLFRADPLRAGILFNEGLSQLEDVDINFRYMLHYPAVVYCATRIYNHSIRTRTSSNMTARMGLEDRASEKFFTAYRSVHAFLKQRQDPDRVDQLVGHLYVTTIILALIRLVRSARLKNAAGAYKKITEITRSTDLRQRLHMYRPGPGDSVAIHKALKLNSPILVMLFTRLRVSVIAYGRNKKSGRR